MKRLIARLIMWTLSMFWLPLEKYKPEDMEQVWTLIPDNETGEVQSAFGIWCEDKQAFFDGAIHTDNEFSYTVTHWLPYPKTRK